jgi:hypothetical protein
MFDRLFQFEKALARYTGAPYVVATDGCTHALELCLRYDRVKACRFTAYTYLSIPQLMCQLDISYELVEERWAGEYQLYGTRIWDSARRLGPGMYRPNTMQCLSFGYGKPVHLGKVGAILLDDMEAYNNISRWRSDGRDLTVSPWQQQTNFGPGYHYCPTLEDCARGTDIISSLSPIRYETPKPVSYPDLRELNIQPNTADLAGRTNWHLVNML